MNYSRFSLLSLCLLVTLGVFTGCNKSEDASPTTTTTLPDVFSKFYNVESVELDGDFVVIRTKDLPDHGSPFYPTTDAKYEPYNGTNSNFSTSISLGGSSQDPDLQEQDITFRIPVNPAEASTKESTPGGPIGVALNGVVIYNQYNGAGNLLDDLEFNNTDQYSGHPSPSNGQYHYHIEPVWLTAQNGKSSLIGFLLDGFPIYGPEEDGKTLVSADLDAYHGHSHATTEFPNGIYHYHTTADAPWINGDGFFGTSGTVSR
ncbi:hypothetical protein BKI52_31830 [marine bacterium AO1-C]|nr:hypothetical protein BKI52_31830 [marine bacterium AO1-C]